MKTQSTLVLTLGILLSFQAWAGRTVTIALPAGATKLTLTNPSQISVSYDVACFKANGSSVGSLTGQSLAPNASVDIPAGTMDAGTCAGGASPIASYTDYTGKKFYRCSGSYTYIDAANACGTGQRFCFPKVTSASACADYSLPYPGCGGADVWLKNEGTVEKYNCGWVSLGAGNYIFNGSSSCTYTAVRNVSTGTGSCGHAYIGITTNANESKGAICCDDSVPAGLCKVTISNSTADAFLASPQFKGGAPF